VMLHTVSSLFDNARDIIYNNYMFIEQAIGVADACDPFSFDKTTERLFV
jgi:hypothetical protein